MAEWIKQYLCCCLPQSRSLPDHTLQDERAPLLNPDILPSAPSRPTQRTTEQEQAERDQLRRILHLAEQRLLSIESLAPFRAIEPTPVATTSSSSSSDSAKNKRSRSSNRRKSRHDDQPASRSLSEESSSSTLTLTAATSPRRSRRRHAAQEQGDDDDEEEESSSRHRRGGESHSRSRVHPAAGDEGAGPLAPIRVVHLDRNTWTEIEVSSQNREVRPGSSHSMKTLPSRQGGKSPVAAGLSGLSITTTSSSDHDDDDDDAAEEDDFQDAEEGARTRSSTRFGTVESYRTAREQGDEDWSTTKRSRDGRRRRHARDLWSQASGKGTEEELARAIEQLERDIDSWTLPPHGPFTADLGGGGGGGGGGEGNGKE
ncbi:hypothetical protein JCM8115_002460 [Rhodotorula mucilaginosa]